MEYLSILFLIMRLLNVISRLDIFIPYTKIIFGILLKNSVHTSIHNYERLIKIDFLSLLHITLISQNMWNFRFISVRFIILFLFNKAKYIFIIHKYIIIQIIELYPPFDQDIFNQDFPSSMELIFLSVNVK